MRASSYCIAHFRALVTEFVRDERGVVHVSELILIASILAIGSIVGLSSYCNAVVSEYNDLGRAVGSLDQSYSYVLSSGATNSFTDTEPDPTDVTATQTGPTAE